MAICIEIFNSTLNGFLLKELYTDHHIANVWLLRYHIIKYKHGMIYRSLFDYHQFVYNMFIGGNLNQVDNSHS